MIASEKILIFNRFLKRGGEKKEGQKWFITLGGLGKVEPTGRFYPETFLAETFPLSINPPCSLLHSVWFIAWPWESGLQRATSNE